jgi:hypothetical protein
MSDEADPPRWRVSLDELIEDLAARYGGLDSVADRDAIERYVDLLS